jgi:NAD(P)-dependent dehydrogenase (short-subunit alcohol dehydrogenase family)
MRLEGKVAIITGSGRGLGKEAAFLFAEEGAKVVVGDINYESAEEVAAAIGEEGGEAMAVKLDVTDSASIQAMVDKVLERFGSIDVLVNNAGMDLHFEPGIVAKFAGVTVRSEPRRHRLSRRLADRPRCTAHPGRSTMHSQYRNTQEHKQRKTDSQDPLHCQTHSSSCGRLT